VFQDVNAMSTFSTRLDISKHFSWSLVVLLLLAVAAAAVYDGGGRRRRRVNDGDV
jgi:hypothetical protein